MSRTYYSLITRYGEQVIAKAIANNTPVPLKTMAVGDGNGTPTMPHASQTALVREVYRAEITDLLNDPQDHQQVIAELLIPETVGNFTVREIGIFDEQNKLVAVANCPENYKPVLEQGSGKVQYYRIILRVSNNDAVTLSINNNIIYATRVELNQLTDNLAAPDGLKYIGQAESIAQLRTVEPTTDQQRILLKSWHAGKNLGGGVFYADFGDTKTADNDGTIVVTAGGKRWKRLYSELTPFDFGAIADGKTNDSDAVSRMQSAMLPINGLGLTMLCDIAPTRPLWTNCRFKIGSLYYPTADYLQADYAKVTNGGIYLSHPQDAGYVLNNQIKCWIGAASSHLDSYVQPAVIISEDGGTSYSPPALLDMTRKQNTIWSAGVAHGMEYLFERMSDVAPFSYRLHKRAVPSGENANYYAAFETQDVVLPMPSWSRDTQPVMIHSFAEYPDGFVVGASFSEGAGLYKSENGGASFEFIELRRGSNFEEPTVKFENGIFAGFIRGGNDGARPSFWISRDNLRTISAFTAPSDLFLNGKLQDVCIPLAIKNGVVHGFTVARNGKEVGMPDEYAPIYYIRANIQQSDNLWAKAEVMLLGYAYHAELNGASACGQGSVVVYRDKLVFLYGSEERTGAHRTGNRIANIHSIILPLNPQLYGVNFNDKIETLRAATHFMTADGIYLPPHGRTVMRSERVISSKYNHIPNTVNDVVIAGHSSSAGVCIITDGAYASYVAIDNDNKMAGLRIDNTNGALHFIAKGDEVMRYDPAAQAFRPHNAGEVDLGAAGKAFRKIYAHLGEINTPPLDANSTEIVNARWVNRRWTDSKSNNGWVKRPDGIIEQWGTFYVGAHGTATVTLPIAFPNRFLNVVLTPDKPRNGHSVTAKTLNNFELKNTEGTECNYMWRALGD